MILKKSDILLINEYFNKFLLENNNEESSLKDEKSLDFYNDWNALMKLVDKIENKFLIKSIISKKNYVGFEISETNYIQDKGINKKEAYFVVCFKTLKELWKNGDIDINFINMEPFDEFDLK